MSGQRRREFLADVGRGMLVASVGAATATDLGLTPCLAAEDSESRLTFGSLEPLVSLMQETEPDRLLPLLVGRIQNGTKLKTLVSAAALANARAFGGQDYTGYHTLMALLPAYQMAQELPAESRALPVLKVLYRNTSRIHAQNADVHDAMHRVERPLPIDGDDPARSLQNAVRDVDWPGAEARFATIAAGPPGEAFNHLQFTIQDEINVHRVVLAWRSWALLGLTGEEHAHSLLRQSVRFCLQSEQAHRERNRPASPIRQLLPQLLDEYRLLQRSRGTRPAEDSWIEELAQTVFTGSRDQAATAVAAALAEGFDPEDVGAAISLAANLLVLHDPGRSANNAAPGKPAGCVHGDSVGVHACDAANAWRNIARVSNHRNQVASLIVAAYHTAGQHHRVTSDPYPYAGELDRIQETDEARLLVRLDEAVEANDQALAAAIADRYGQLELPPRSLFERLLKYGVSQDGALHAEKYYRTVSEEFASSRPVFRWRQTVALARVTASQFGYPAPGYAESRELLRLG